MLTGKLKILVRPRSDWPGHFPQSRFQAIDLVRVALANLITTSFGG